MSETFSYKAAIEALKAEPMSAQGKTKDCSAKHHKVYLLEKEIEAEEDRVRDAGRAANAAWRDYEHWKNDPGHRDHYSQIYRDKLAVWHEAKAKVLGLEKKKHTAERAAWACEASSYAGKG